MFLLFNLQSFHLRCCDSFNVAVDILLLFRNCTSKGDQESLESQFGTRYTVLSLLPYYDTIRMPIIDPMHNLFMGKLLSNDNESQSRNHCIVHLFLV